jgi:hypothetical protein
MTNNFEKKPQQLFPPKLQQVVPPKPNPADGHKGGRLRVVTQRMSGWTFTAKGGDAAPGGKGGDGGELVVISGMAKNINVNADAGKNGPPVASEEPPTETQHEAEHDAP